jgi:hypothetical protein
MNDITPGTEHLHDRMRKVHQRLANTMIERRLCAARLMTYDAEVAELQETAAALRRAVEGMAQSDSRTTPSRRRAGSRR